MIGKSIPHILRVENWHMRVDGFRTGSHSLSGARCPLCLPQARRRPLASDKARQAASPLRSRETAMTPSVAEHFPALRSGFSYLDNASGAQVPTHCIEALTDFLTR